MKYFKYLLYLLLSTSSFLIHAQNEAADFFAAVVRDDGDMVMTYMVRGIDPNMRDAKGDTALLVALRERSWKAADTLMQYPALDVNAVNQAGETSLMLAALRGRLDWVKWLHARGAHVNKSGWTPLHYAASSSDDSTCVDWLLKQGAESNARSPNGTTALMMASRYGKEDSVDLLLKAGADKTLRNGQGLNALDFARAAGREFLFARLQ